MTPHEATREFKMPFWKEIVNEKKNGLWIPMGVFVVISGLILQFLFGSIPTRVANVEQKQASQATEIKQLQEDVKELKVDVKAIRNDVSFIRGIMEQQQKGRQKNER